MIKLDAILRELPALFCALFIAILFIQSGLDKVLDWNGNLGFLKDHFSKTVLAGLVPMMLATITLLEVATGLFAAAGIVYFIFSGSMSVVFYAAILGAIALTALFFGQRIAKDYPGAAVLVPYFLLVLLLMILSAPQTPRGI